MQASPCVLTLCCCVCGVARLVVHAGQVPVWWPGNSSCDAAAAEQRWTGSIQGPLCRCATNSSWGI